MSFLSTAVRQVLDEGVFCSVVTTTPRGPHCTPLVYAFSGGRVWLTTSRGSVKARAWRADPAMAGLVRHGDLVVSFTGRVHAYDLLDRGTWGASVAGAPAIARASVRFSKKNARFFAGYAVDARQVPFAWTPPGRVFVGIDVERTALLDQRGVDEGKGRWGGDVESHATFRAAKQGADPLGLLPTDVAGALGREGAGTLAVVGAHGPVALPVRWRADANALYAVLPEESLSLVDAGPDAAVALTVDLPSAWRARDMVGAMVQGTGSFHVVDQLGSGARSARTLATSIDPEAGALVRIAPDRLVWWKGWSSGSADVA
jgi:nitroimidazol reductase NimA-like FMN-containing flavoprotein (pyridoxamine 5'-phosphate oxidase superfamily)